MSQAADPRRGKTDVWRVPYCSNEGLVDRRRKPPGPGPGAGSSPWFLKAATPLSSRPPNGWEHNPEHKSPRSTKATGLSGFKEECRKGGGRPAFIWVILDYCHAYPGPPLKSVLAKQGKASGLEPLRGCGLWRDARLQGPSPMVAEHSERGLGWAPCQVPYTMALPFSDRVSTKGRNTADPRPPF